MVTQLVVVWIRAPKRSPPKAPPVDNVVQAVAAMHGGGTIDRISKSIHVHPTLSEVLAEAAE